MLIQPAEVRAAPAHSGPTVAMPPTARRCSIPACAGPSRRHDLLYHDLWWEEAQLLALLGAATTGVRRKSPSTPVQWLKATIEAEDRSEDRTYWVPAFTDHMDVFQVEAVKCRSDGLVGCILHHAKIDRYRFGGVPFHSTPPRGTNQRASSLHRPEKLFRKLVQVRSLIDG